MRLGMYNKNQIIDKFNTEIENKQEFEAVIAPKLASLSKAIKELQLAGIDVEIELKQLPSLQAFEMTSVLHPKGGRYNHGGAIIIGQVRRIFAISSYLNSEQGEPKSRNILFLHGYDSGEDYPIARRQSKNDHEMFDLDQEGWEEKLQDDIIRSYARLCKINQNDPYNAFSYNKNGQKPAPQKLPLPSNFALKKAKRHDG